WNAESVEVAYSFGICYLSANPCQRLQGFAAQLAELFASHSLIQLRLEARRSKAQTRKVLKQELGTLRSPHRSAGGRARQLPSAGRTPAQPGRTVPSAGSPPGSAPGAAAGAGGVSFRGIVGRRDAAGASPGAPRAGRAGGSRQPAGPGRAGFSPPPRHHGKCTACPPPPAAAARGGREGRRPAAPSRSAGQRAGSGAQTSVSEQSNWGCEYASLYFCCAIEDQDNELLTLEIVHRYVELLDRYFGNVCELDIIFNFEKAYFILDEFIIGGEVQDTSKRSAVKAIEDSDMLQETVEEYMNKPAF
uniref:AP complex mu/sigma subunit domain-containing protein n=1 Tax=Phasianus colchicus TaxID=9054 RepID=A0A669PME5_PHACC